MDKARLALNNLRLLTPAKKPIRVGRGRSSRRPQTAGRGHKGQWKRNSVPIGFAGGQTPIFRTAPKHGFVNQDQVRYEPLNLEKLDDFIQRGKIDPDEPINMRTLWKAGAVGKIVDGVKLLGKGANTFSTPVTIEVSQASRSAIEAIERAGGKIECKYYNKLGLRALLKPEKFPNGPPRLPLPRHRLYQWYANPDNRGYLVTRVGLSSEAESKA